MTLLLMCKRLEISLALITIYWLFMSLLRPTGISLLKVSIALLPWFSFLIVIFSCQKNFRPTRQRMPSFLSSIFILLILLNILNIVRGSLNEHQSLATVFGNPYNSIALLAPFALVFGLHKKSIAIINRFFIYSTAIGSILFIILYGGLNVVDDNSHHLQSAMLLITPVIFLIGNISYNNRINRFIIYSGSILLFGYLGLMIGNRSTAIRVVSLYFSNVVVFFYQKIKLKLLFILVISMTLLPYIMIYYSYYSGESIFVEAHQYFRYSFKSPSSVKAVIEKSDTRTFLYREIINDLDRTNGLLFGKGSSGTYYSPYFHRAKGDSDTRLTVEVGVLALLLKGGVVAVILNLAMFYFSIFLSIFKSNNQYIRWVGFMLLVHTLLLFVENIICYNIYNFMIWFSVGSCLSKEIRNMSDLEIRSTLNRMPKIFSRITW